MRLTTLMRSSFVRAVMQDVPEIDYSSKIHKLALDDAVAQMAPSVRRVYKGYPEHFNNTARYVDGVGSFYGPWGDHKINPMVADAIRGYAKLRDEQRAQRTLLQQSLSNVARGCTTRKQLAEALPEFVKYLPADTPKPGANLPAVAHVVAQFVKAGWPKKNQKPAHTLRQTQTV
jgi:hypothetical protein